MEDSFDLQLREKQLRGARNLLNGAIFETIATTALLAAGSFLGITWIRKLISLGSEKTIAVVVLCILFGGAAIFCLYMLFGPLLSALKTHSRALHAIKCGQKMNEYNDKEYMVTALSSKSIVLCSVFFVAFIGIGLMIKYDFHLLKTNDEGGSYSNPYSNTFTNKYGTPTTKCAHPGCSNYIASSGDTNCCTIHSHKCVNCGKYIDEDATFCMDCLNSAFD